MKRMLLIFGWLLATACDLLLVTACAPVYQSYHYISLAQNPDINILEYGKFDRGHLINHNEMPVRYELARSLYALHFELDLKQPNGYRMVIRLNSRSAPPFKVIGGVLPTVSPVEECERYSNHMFPHDNIPNDEQALSYTWYLFRSGCALDGDENSKIMSFHVIDERGEIAGEEVLFFRFVRNGGYISYDAI